MKKMMCQFMEQMGLNVEDVEGQFQQFQDQNKGKKNSDWCHKNWNAIRAIPVTVPDHVLEAQPGQILLPAIEVQNGTHWPWKNGCVLTLAQEAAETFENLPIEMINVPVDFEVRGKATFKMQIPLKVHDHAVASDNTHEIKIAFRGPGGHQFGEVITLKLKVIMPSNENAEVEAMKLAIKLQELNLGSFDECLNAVRITNSDEKAAITMLQSKKQ
jgi:hypothetical protein